MKPSVAYSFARLKLFWLKCPLQGVSPRLTFFGKFQLKWFSDFWEWGWSKIWFLSLRHKVLQLLCRGALAPLCLAGVGAAAHLTRSCCGLSHEGSPTTCSSLAVSDQKVVFVLAVCHHPVISHCSLSPQKAWVRGYTKQGSSGLWCSWLLRWVREREGFGVQDGGVRPWMCPWWGQRCSSVEKGEDKGCNKSRERWWPGDGGVQRGVMGMVWGRWRQEWGKPMLVQHGKGLCCYWGLFALKTNQAIPEPRHLLQISPPPLSYFYFSLSQTALNQTIWSLKTPCLNSGSLSCPGGTPHRASQELALGINPFTSQARRELWASQWLRETPGSSWIPSGKGTECLGTYLFIYFFHVFSRC